MKRDAVLLAAIGLSPVAWFISLEANFALAPLACGSNGKPGLYAVAAVSLLVAVFAGALSFTQFRIPVLTAAGDPNPFWPRHRAMALAGMSLSAMAFLLIVAQMIPNLLLRGCE